MATTSRVAGTFRILLRVIVVLGLLTAARPAPAQVREPAAAPEPAEAEDEDEEAALEIEFIASTAFQAATTAFRLNSPLLLEAHYFGVDDNEIGMAGLAWELSAGALRFVPGVAWSVGAENRPAPVITARWVYDGGRWLTEGLWVQSLRAYIPATDEDGEEDGVKFASILDGVHASLRLGRAEFGPMVERIQYREELEWKGGARVAWRLRPGLRLVSQIVGPGVEVRGGLAWER